MNKKQFTAEQLLTRWEIRREVQNIMGKYSQSYCIKQEGALPQFWSGRDDISLGLNQGYYIGQAAVNGYYAAIEAETKLASQLIAARFPQKLQGKTEEELFGVGQISYRPIDTAVIEVADDLADRKGTLGRPWDGGEGHDLRPDFLLGLFLLGGGLYSGGRCVEDLAYAGPERDRQPAGPVPHRGHTDAQRRSGFCSHVRHYHAGANKALHPAEDL